MRSVSTLGKFYCSLSNRWFSLFTRSALMSTGGNRYEQSSYCVHETVGEVDALIWEFNMIAVGGSSRMMELVLCMWMCLGGESAGVWKRW